MVLELCRDHGVLRPAGRETWSMGSYTKRILRVMLPSSFNVLWDALIRTGRWAGMCLRHRARRTLGCHTQAPGALGLTSEGSMEEGLSGRASVRVIRRRGSVHITAPRRPKWCSSSATCIPGARPGGESPSRVRVSKAAPNPLPQPG